MRFPRWRPRIPVLFYAHPFELAIGFVLFISGIRAFVSGDSSPTINDALPPAVLVTFQVVSFLAGTLILIGLPIRRKPQGRALERAGCVLAAGTYTGYGVILAFTLPLGLAWSTLSTILALAFAFWLRAKSIRKTELTIERTLRAANRASDPLDLVRRIVDSRGMGGDR